jgi:hypothetical protein
MLAPRIVAAQTSTPAPSPSNADHDLRSAIARIPSEIVIAIRYLRAEGTSHSHLYLYREDGKLVRQLTNDNFGQDVDPIFAPGGETIVSRARNLMMSGNFGVSILTAGR